MNYRNMALYFAIVMLMLQTWSTMQQVQNLKYKVTSLLVSLAKTLVSIGAPSLSSLSPSRAAGRHAQRRRL